MDMDAKVRFTMQEGDLELVDSVEKYNSHHDSRGRFGSNTGGPVIRPDGANALHRNLQPKLDSLSSKIDALPKDREIAADTAQAKVHLASAAKAPDAKGSATALQNVGFALDRAAKTVVGRKTPLAIALKDIRDEANLISDALQRA